MRKKWIILITLFLLSYFVNATVRYKDFFLLCGDLKFCLGAVLTIPLLFIYAVIISKSFRAAHAHDLHPYGWHRYLRRLGLFLLIILINGAIVQFVLMGSVPLWIWETTYFRDDFPFLAIPLALYISTADNYPGSRVFWARSDRQPPGNLWTVYREPRFLLEALRNDLPPMDAEAVYCARLCDIVLIESFNKIFVAYLATGKKVVFDFPVSHLKGSMIWNWLLKTKSRYLVNMLYAHTAAETWKIDKRIVLDKQVLEAILQQEDEEKVATMLSISRHYEERTKSFFENMQQLETKGWEETIMSYATSNKKSNQ